MILELLIDWLSGALVTVPLTLIAIFLFDRTRAKRRWFWMVLLTVYLSAMYIIVGVPDWRYITWDFTVNLVPFQDFSTSNLMGMALNAAMFAPLGFLLPAYFDRYRSFVPTLDAGILTNGRGRSDYEHPGNRCGLSAVQADSGPPACGVPGKIGLGLASGAECYGNSCHHVRPVSSGGGTCGNGSIKLLFSRIILNGRPMAARFL